VRKSRSGAELKADGPSPEKQHEGNEEARQAIGHLLYTGRGGLDFPHELHELVECAWGVCAHRHGKGIGLDHASSDHRIALGFPDGFCLPRQERLVDGGSALGHCAVHRDAFPLAHPHRIAGREVIHVDRFGRPVWSHAPRRVGLFARQVR